MRKVTTVMIGIVRVVKLIMIVMKMKVRITVNAIIIVPKVPKATFWFIHFAFTSTIFSNNVLFLLSSWLLTLRVAGFIMILQQLKVKIPK